MSYLSVTSYQVVPEVETCDDFIRLRFNGLDAYACLDLAHAEKLQRDLAEAVATVRAAEKAEAA